MRAKSFGAEKRKKQDQQGWVAISVLLVMLIGDLFVPAIRPWCIGGMQGAWPALLVMALRYGIRVINGKRRDKWAVIDALLFIAATVYIAVRHYPHDVYHFAIILLCFIGTVLGVQRFKYTLIFMLINCMLAGIILL